MGIINQINIDLGILKITNGIHLAEAVLLLVIIVIQVYQTIRTWKKIDVLKDVFNKRIRLRQGWIDEKDLKEKEQLLSKIQYHEPETIASGNYRKITVVEARGNNKILIRIKDALNHYLIRNYGAVVNFGIIKDIIEREVDNYDEEISQSIPTPLYLGLGATMLGIIFGLLAIPGISTTSGGDDTREFVGIINPLIDGVKIAMIASMLGLFMTTILSSFKYKSARLFILNSKNRLLTYLETELLPELYETEDSGVSGLKSSLDQFSRNAESIVSRVDETVQRSYSNIREQMDLVKRVDQLDINKISRLNLEVFQYLERNLEAFTGFSNYLASMEKIAGNLHDFATRTNNVDHMVGQINKTLDDSGRLTRFLTLHFEEMERMSEKAQQAVTAAGSTTTDAFNLAESHFKQAIVSLENEIDNRIQLLNTRVNFEESKLTEKYEQFRQDMHEVTSRHLEAFRHAYENAVPRFEQLDNLQELSPIKEIIDNNTRTLQAASTENSNKLNESINKLNDNLERIISQNTNSQLLEKITEIEKKLGSNGRRTPSVRKRVNIKLPKRFIKIPVPKFLQRRKGNS